MAARTTRAVYVLIAVAVVAVVGAVGLRALWNTAKAHLAADLCTVGGYQVETQQAEVAATMVGAVTRYPGNLPERASVLVLAAGLQESKLTNIPAGSGDRDSVGVLQQRPSQGWGSVPGQPDSIAARARRLTDVGFATTAFLDYLVQHVPKWRTMSLAAAAQAVQRSADPSGESYAQHEDEAKALAAALLGSRPAAITCDIEKPTKVAPAARVADTAASQLGIATPRATDRLTVRVPGARWQTAAWFVAYAYRFGIERVAYAGKVWTRTAGWRPGTASRTAVVATLYDLQKN